MFTLQMSTIDNTQQQLSLWFNITAVRNFEQVSATRVVRRLSYIFDLKKMVQNKRTPGLSFKLGGL